MNASRRSLFGFGVAAASLAVASKVKAAPVQEKANSTPRHSFYAKGEIKEVFSHFEPVYPSHTHSLSTINSPVHTHSYTGCHSWAAARSVSNQVIFDGLKFVPLLSVEGSKVVADMRSAA